MLDNNKILRKSYKEEEHYMENIAKGTVFS